jgi:hypothetical protein
MRIAPGLLTPAVCFRDCDRGVGTGTRVTLGSRRKAGKKECPFFRSAYAYGRGGLLSVSHGPHELVKLKGIGRWAAVYTLTAAASY